MVLAARTTDALDRAVLDIESRGGEALAVVADVGGAEQVRHVAAQAIRRFGRIDAWVNNAGVGIWGRLEEVSEADMRRLFDTNFWGIVHGSLTALPHLRVNGGALINMGSMVSERAVPLQGIYIRVEIRGEGLHQRPAGRTGKGGGPRFRHAGQARLDRHAHAPARQELYRPRGPVPAPHLSPCDVARVILHAASHPVRDAYVGGAAVVTSVMSKLAPPLTDLVSEAVLFEAQLGPEPPDPRNNLWQGDAQATVRGDHPDSRIRHSLYSAAAMSPKLVQLAGGIALLGVLSLLPRPGRR